MQSVTSLSIHLHVGVIGVPQSAGQEFDVSVYQAFRVAEKPNGVIICLREAHHVSSLGCCIVPQHVLFDAILMEHPIPLSVASLHEASLPSAEHVDIFSPSLYRLEHLLPVVFASQAQFILVHTFSSVMLLQVRSHPSQESKTYCVLMAHQLIALQFASVAGKLEQLYVSKVQDPLPCSQIALPQVFADEQSAGQEVLVSIYSGYRVIENQNFVNCVDKIAQSTSFFGA